MRTMRTVLALLALLGAASTRADTVEATSTTYISAAKQPRGALPGQAADLAGVVPVIEVVSVSARGIRNPVFDDLSVVVSTWGAFDLQDRRWDAGTSGNLTGDVVTGYVQGRLWSRRATLRLGRQLVALGAARVASIDGADVALRLPLGIGLDAYAGVPVSQRFSARSASGSWNALGGDLAYGGRASWGLTFAGATARGFEVGASAAFVDDGGDAVRRDVGVDGRLQLIGNLALNGKATWAVEEEEPLLAEAAVVATWRLARAWFVTADWRHSRPDLMLPRTSILSVFAESERSELGGGARWELTHQIEVGADYHALLEPGEDGTGTELGHEAALRGDYRHGPVQAGGELSWLSGAENGYVGARFFARRELGRFFAAGDVQVYAFSEAVNGQDYAANAGATGGVRLGKAWTASVTGRAGITPFMEQQADVMAKLVYNQTYRVREVR